MLRLTVVEAAAHQTRLRPLSRHATRARASSSTPPGPSVSAPRHYTATFSSGVTKASNRSDCYSSGDYAWHVLNETSATVTFETLPSTLTFFVRSELAATVSDIQVLDENGDLIVQMTPTNILQQVIVNRAVGQTLVGSVVVTSTSGGDVVIDDCIFLIG